MPPRFRIGSFHGYLKSLVASTFLTHGGLGILRRNKATTNSHGRCDWILVGSTVVLSLWGIFHLYTISFPHQSYYFIRQTMWVGMGMGLLFLFSCLKPSSWKKASYSLYGIFFFILILVLVIGEGTHGAQRWLRVGMFSFQPSEFIKLSLILILAKTLAFGEGISWVKLGLSFSLTILPLVLIVLQPDMGTALILLPLWLGMLFLAGASLKKMAVILGVGIFLFPLSFFLLRPYQKMRIITFLNPQRDPLGAGWSSLQSKIALGSGKLVGRGMGEALHTRLKFLPQPFTDFIFASLGEEWGFIGVLFLFTLYFIIILRGVKIARETGSDFARLVSGGIVILLFLQVFINLGMVAGMMPVTGIPLPLMSYGGSSVLMFLAGIGILVSIDKFGLKY